jgi:hypothetical protein
MVLSATVPLITTDKPDYAPASTAVIDGTGFQPGETVMLQVLHTDGLPNTDSAGNPLPGYGTWEVTDGGAGDLDGKKDGHIETSWFVPDSATNSTLQLTATGESSQLTAQEAFTDALSNPVNKANQTITFGTLANQTYGVADFTLSATSSSGLAVTYTATGNASILSGDQVHITGAGSATITAHQAGDANYNGAADVSQTFSIAQAPLTAHITAGNKVYDGSTAATITNHSLSGVFGTDAVSLIGGIASFADKTAANGKSVTALGLTLTGSAAGNYVLLSTTATATANIMQRGLTVTAAGVNRIYDGTIAAAVALSDNKVAGDSINDSCTSATFADKHVGTGKTVLVTGISITGDDAGNYALQNTTASTTANIAALAITGSITAGNKTYDGTAAATITSRTLSGQLSGDDVAYVGGTATFAGKNAGAGQTVTATGLSLTGADAGNYTVNDTATTTATIDKATLSVTADSKEITYGAASP